MGKLVISRYEYEKNMKAYIDDYNIAYNSIPSKDSIEKWDDYFTKRAYIAADALEKGFDTLPVILYQIEAMSQNMITKIGGYFMEQRRGS
ncbi:MAG: hypothetical protein HC905_28945 [Bacteroidales bacterium]|nr:hypothetical protein [Bacteroidales bacterium]